MTSQPTLACREERRRRLTRAKGWNGIDYVEVADDLHHLELCVHFFGQVPKDIAKEDLRIEGGRRVRDIQVVSVAGPESSGAEGGDCLRVKVDKPGDFSIYTLRLLGVGDGKQTRFPRFDPRYAHAQFSFKAGCPSTLDCQPESLCPPEKRDEPEINYLAKDYASFRQLILDRLALILPDWQERHVPDLGIALVEVLAYVGDYLSYYQDAVGTEAYLNTARQRISVRRHARLVDYQMHEGCNARALLCLATDTDLPLDLSDCYFITPVDGAAPPGGSPLKHDDLNEIPPSRYEVFEPMDPKTLRLWKGHNEIQFYTWADQVCCLPCGATSATLKDGWMPGKEPGPALPPPREQTGPAQTTAAHCPPPPPEPPKRERQLHLERGDLLIFEEVIGPKTGRRADADPSRRWAVRLTRVEPGIDPVKEQPIVEIEWAPEDALPFPFCLSARLPAPDCTLVSDVSVARGNVILVDHGQTVDEPGLGQVERGTQIGECECEGSVVDISYLPKAFQPVLKRTPLTFREPLRPGSPASRLLKQDPRKALPQVKLTGLPGACPEGDDRSEPQPAQGVDPTDPKWLWHPRRDLLGSQGLDQDFVAEIDSDGRAHLRFGDGELGRLPEACMIFNATYRVGNGPAGNVGAESISVLVTRRTALSGVQLQPRNPLPAQGGAAAEPMAEVKLFAPGAFRKDLQRAILADDYARIVERDFADPVQRAGAALRWTGSWYAAQVAVDPRGSEGADRHLLQRIKGRLHRYRRLGHDVEVAGAHYVPLDIEICVCVLPHYLRGHIEAALLDLFSSGVRSDGRPGFFHPDNLTFGEGIFASKMVAAAQALPGVESVRVTRLERYAEGDHGELAEGILRLGALEVAQLDNDPSFPEHGTLSLKLGGGR